MVSDLVHKFHKIHTRGTTIMEWIPDKFVFFYKSMGITPEQEKCSRPKSNLICLYLSLTMWINLNCFVHKGIQATKVMIF
jgi:hypothetical protein